MNFSTGLQGMLAVALLSPLVARADDVTDYVKGQMENDKLTVIVFTNQRAAQQMNIARGVAGFYIAGLAPDPVGK